MLSKVGISEHKGGMSIIRVATQPQLGPFQADQGLRAPLSETVLLPSTVYRMQEHYREGLSFLLCIQLTMSGAPLSQVLLFIHLVSVHLPSDPVR